MTFRRCAPDAASAPSRSHVVCIVIRIDEVAARAGAGGSTRASREVRDYAMQAQGGSCDTAFFWKRIWSAERDGCVR